MVLFNSKEDCCGCTACKNICPKSAIDMVPDEEGFLYPQINKDLCIECGLCQNVCPVKVYDKIDKEGNPDVYAVKNKDENTLLASSSGAVFSVLADFITNENGVVYGATYDKNCKVCHSNATIKDECIAFRGSKYVQSDLGDTFLHVREYLSNSRKVLFSGTPCQVAGLKQLINKTDDNLYTCDLICHGVPSPMLFKDYVSFIEKKARRKIVSINMKDKTNGWGGQGFRIHFDDGCNWINREETKFWTSLFYSECATRPSCHTCRFTNFKRPGDITLGDYWGIEKVHSSFYDRRGVSLVLISNDKGKTLFENVKDSFEYISSQKSLCLQPNLQHSSKVSPLRNKFWNDYKSRGFLYVVKKYGNVGWRKRLDAALVTIKRIVKRIIKR